MNDEMFAVTMGLLKEEHGFEYKKHFRLELLWPRVKNMTDEQFKAGINNLLESFVPTSTVPQPLLPHFMKAFGLDKDSRASKVIEVVRGAIRRYGRDQSVDFGDPALHSVIMRYGGWPSICDWTDDDWKFKESAFIAHYKNFSMFGGSTKYLPGVAEEENSLHAKWWNTPIEKVALPWSKHHEIEDKTEKHKQIAREPQEPTRITKSELDEINQYSQEEVEERKECG